MAGFSYICNACGWRMDSQVSVMEPVCYQCSAKMDRDWANFRFQVSGKTRDYVTSDITGYPVRIQSLRQEERLCKEHGVLKATSDECTGGKKFGSKYRPVETELSRDQKRAELKDAMQAATAELKREGKRMPTPKELKRMKPGDRPAFV